MKSFKIYFCFMVSVFFLLCYVADLKAQPAETDSYGSLSNNGVLGNLSGEGRYVAVPHSNNLHPGLNGTVEAWVYLNSYNPNGSYILQKGLGFGLAINVINQLTLRVNNTTFLQGGNVPTGRWVHVAVAWTNSSPNMTASFYIDGIQTALVIEPGTTGSNTDSLTIGGSKLSPFSYLNGYVDEVRLWNQSYNGNTIAQRRFTGIGDAPNANADSALIYGLYYNGLVASWTFNIGGNLIYEDINNKVGICRGGAAPVFTNVPAQPIPYNLVMYFPGRQYDYIKVPNNAALNLTNSGSIDLWVNYVPSATGRTLISKGSTLANTTFRLYIESSGSLRLQIGNNSVPGGVVPNSRWVHIAVTWSLSGGTYTCKFYIDGKYTGQNTMVTVMPVNNDDLRIGGLQWDVTNYFAGYMDELRIWNNELSAASVYANMFNSARSQNLAGTLVAAWDFEGNLNNVIGNPALNGSFKTNSVFTPWCTFSGYSNENTTGPISDVFSAHSTTINRNESPVNPFPGGFALRLPDKNINTGTTVYDTIYIPGSNALTNLEVFLSLQGTRMGGIIVKLKAPNGQERILVNGNGGLGNSILTFFKDGSPAQSSFFAPWSYLVSPNQAFSNFGGSNSQGSWILTIQHNGTVAAKLLGWGLRINNSITGVQPVSGNIPERFCLQQNFPNPFNPVTSIFFSIPKESNVKFTVYDVLGKEVMILVNEKMSAGSFKVDLDGSGLSSGTYFYKLETESFSDVKKMVLVK
ncbi:MAG: T9SS type A sorting domain-containing protein [Ignavibacteria bacterium]|nr:T9SS type A sorting domain-containing protein [Ignavibacteria bacterium]